MTRAIADQCFQLLDDLHRNWHSPDVRHRWRALWQDTVEGDKIQAADVGDAALILSVGWQIAMQDADYRRAVELSRAFLAHPDLNRADVVDRLHMAHNLALSLLCTGEEAEGLRTCQSVLALTEERAAQLAPLVVRNCIMAFFEMRSHVGEASAELTDLVIEVVRRLRADGSPPCTVPAGATYGELAELLRSTYPRRPTRPH